jgi:zinc transporter ZupT
LQLAPSETKPKESNGHVAKDVVDKSKEKSILSAIRSFVIVLALSIHAIFEGMAIGEID